MKVQVKMILKNGAEIRFECDTIQTNIDKKTGELEEWGASGVSRTHLDGVPAYISPSEIAAIMVKDFNDYSRKEPTIKPEEVEENEKRI